MPAAAVRVTLFSVEVIAPARRSPSVSTSTMLPLVSTSMRPSAVRLVLAVMSMRVVWKLASRLRLPPAFSSWAVTWVSTAVLPVPNTLTGTLKAGPPPSGL